VAVAGFEFGGIGAAPLAAGFRDVDGGADRGVWWQ
jgi:hypothetical protein